MNREHAAGAQAAETRIPTTLPAVLDGRLLMVARAAWLLTAVVSITLFAASLPFAYRQMVEPCVGSGCGYFQLSPQDMLAL